MPTKNKLKVFLLQIELAKVEKNNLADLNLRVVQKDRKTQQLWFMDTV